MGRILSKQVCGRLLISSIPAFLLVLFLIVANTIFGSNNANIEGRAKLLCALDDPDNQYRRPLTPEFAQESSVIQQWIEVAKRQADRLNGYTHDYIEDVISSIKEYTRRFPAKNDLKTSLVPETAQIDEQFKRYQDQLAELMIRNNRIIKTVLNDMGITQEIPLGQAAAGFVSSTLPVTYRCQEVTVRAGGAYWLLAQAQELISQRYHEPVLSNEQRELLNQELRDALILARKNIKRAENYRSTSSLKNSKNKETRKKEPS